MPVARIDEIAQGRVWTGAEAVRINLADQIGTIEDAITWAALSIDGVNAVEDVSIVGYPKPLTSLELLMEGLGGNQEQSISLGNWKTSDSGKVYARMTYEYIMK